MFPSLSSETAESQLIIFTNYNVMMKKKYENPESELLIVRFEGNFCTTGNYGDPGQPGGPNPYAPGDGEDMD